MDRLSRTGCKRPLSLIWALLCLLSLFSLIACGGEDQQTAEARGQITRPGDIGLPLDNAESEAAFDVADDLLLDWFLLRDIESALNHMHPNFRDAYRSLLENTEIDRTCSLLQVEGSVPDASGVVTARYAIGGCRVKPPSVNTAVYVELTMTAGEGGPWVSQIEFLR